MIVKHNPAIVGEFSSYRKAILSSPPEVVKQDGDVLELTRRLDLETRSDGTWCSRKSLAAGATIGGDEERIVERYSYDSIFGVQETAWRVETVYVAYEESGRTIIEKTSTDVVHHEELSSELVDAETAEVLDEWFISDYRQKVVEPRHAPAS